MSSLCRHSLHFLAALVWVVACYAQSSDVLTGHNDTYRTGWQQNESILSPSAVQNSFGLLWQYEVNGAVFAQPLTYHSSQQIGSQNTCTNCDVVFIADEQDNVYAFEADTSSQQLLWSNNLAGYWDCIPGYPLPCGNGVIGPDMGITSTPVIDALNQIIYVVALENVSGSPEYYLWALNLLDGTPLASVPISASYTGVSPGHGNNCQAVNTGTGTLTFDSTEEIQRTGLLVLGDTGTGIYGTVYVAFAPADTEWENGWLLGYQYSPAGSGSLTQVYKLNTTPYGTGGGMWEGGDGLVAADANVGGNQSSYIFVPTGNGTFDVGSPRSNYGDTLLRLIPTSLVISDFFTPSNQDTLCNDDLDLDSGGLIALPDETPPLLSEHPRLMVAADKEAKLFVVDRDNLTGFHSSGDEIVQEIQTPTGSNVYGYWGYPAYFRWTNQQGATRRALYYSVREAQTSEPALPIDQYILTTTGPIPSSYYSTLELYCGYGAVPSVSSNGSTGGILWAIEDTNIGNEGPPYSCPSGANEPGTDYLDIALHAYDATNIGTELYNGRGHNSSPHTGLPVKFATPTIFNGKVFAGARNEANTGGIVDVWGLCSEGPNQMCLE